MGRSTPQDADDDREMERLLGLSEDEIMEELGGREEYDRATREGREAFERAVLEVERRVGATFNRLLRARD